MHDARQPTSQLLSLCEEELPDHSDANTNKALTQIYSQITTQLQTKFTQIYLLLGGGFARSGKRRRRRGGEYKNGFWLPMHPISLQPRNTRTIIAKAEILLQKGILLKIQGI